MYDVLARLFALVGLLALSALSAPHPVMAQGTQRCFPETDLCISGRFRQFWDQNGGLPVFGLPISAAVDAVNPDTGATPLTQWFERNRFELHPEHAAPFDVLLGRLGDDALHEQGRDWRASPASRPQDSCLWVAQTGHNICDQAPGMGFKTYWTGHGLRNAGLDAYGRSLALFGLPLTEAALERNAADGELYVTQWFERARLEWHPDKPAAYTVLLGLLGAELQTSPPAPRLKYFWPEVVPLGMVIQPDDSSATESTFTLNMAASRQFYATVSGGAGSEAPQRGDVLIVTVRGQRGIAFTTGAGYTLFWTENGQPYAIRGNLPLLEAMRLAEGLTPLDLATWRARLT